MSIMLSNAQPGCFWTPSPVARTLRFGGIAGSADMAAEGPSEHELNRTA
jgi:hypothetical protein